MSVYLQLKSQMPRGRNVTYKAFRDALGSETVGTATGARIATSYWLVPKENFPHGLPRSIVDWELTYEQLCERFEVPTDWSAEGRYIVDQHIPRNKLRAHVSSYEFYSKSEKEIKTSKASSSTGLPQRAQKRRSPPVCDAESSSDDVEMESFDESEDSKPLNALKPVKLESGETPSTGTGSTAASALESPPALQTRPLPRVLRMEISEEVDDDRTLSADAILTNMLQAAQHGALYHSNNAASHTVHFWVTQMVFALAKPESEAAVGAQTTQTPLKVGMTSDSLTRELQVVSPWSVVRPTRGVAAATTISMVVVVAADGTRVTPTMDAIGSRCNFGVVGTVGHQPQAKLVPVLVLILLDNDCVHLLRHFMPLIVRLRALGCKVPSITTAIEALSTAVKDKPLGEARFHVATGARDALGDLSGKPRFRFFKSALYVGFLRRQGEAA